MTSAIGQMWREAVTEALKVFSIRRNLVLIAAGLVLTLATPWVFLAAFAWVRDQGVMAASVEVVALAQRNQTVALALMVLLGLQAYLSDAANGLLASALAGSNRLAVAGGKLLFGLLAAVAFGIGATASAWIATLVIGLPEPGLAAVGEPQFWAGSMIALVAALLLHYLLGLVVAVLTRSKGLAIAAGLLVPFVLVTLVKGALRAVSPAAGEAASWLLPTELASGLLSWTPGGNTLMDAPVEGLAQRAVLLGLWLVMGAGAWLLVVKRRRFYPADQG